MNQKPINNPSKSRLSTIVPCTESRHWEALDTWEGYAQLITGKRQWCYEPDARDEAKDFGDKCVKAAKDEQATEDLGTDITNAGNHRWVAALHGSTAARRVINGHAQYGAIPVSITYMAGCQTRNGASQR